MSRVNWNKRSRSDVADRSHSRTINQQAILNGVCQNPGISKAQLAKALGISKPAISSNVEELIDMGLLLERGEGEVGALGGRKPTPLFFNEKCCYVGALDLSFQEPVCAVADLNSTIIGLKKIQTHSSETSQCRKENVKKAFLEILEQNNMATDQLNTIVISHPGIFREGGYQHYAEEKHHLWTEIGLTDYLKQELNVQVFARNDVNLAAVGELYYGCDRALENLIYISCGVGLGAAMIVQKKLYTGEQNAAGEIGACLMADGSRIEDFVAIEGLIQRTEALFAGAGRAGKLTFSEIVELVKTDHPLACQAVYETGQVLGRLIFNLCVSLDIRTVIFGGEYMELGEALWKGIREPLTKSQMIEPEVIPSELLYTAGLYGCFVVGKEKAMAHMLLR